MIGRERLGLGDIEPGAGEMTALERVEQGLVIDETAAGAVDEERSGRHRRQCGRVDDVVRGRRRRRMQADHVRPAPQRIGVDERDVQPVRDDERVVGDRVHAERSRDHGDATGDATETEQTERPAVELDTGRRTRLGRGRALRPAADVLGHGQQERDGVLGRRHRRRVGCEADGDATGRGCHHVDGVIPDTGARDDAQPGGEIHRRAVPAAATGDHDIRVGKIDVVRSDGDGTTLKKLGHALGHHPVEEEHRRRSVIGHRPQCTDHDRPPCASWRGSAPTDGIDR